MPKNILILLFLCLLVASPAGAAEKIVVAGTGDSQFLMQKLAAAYEKAHPGTRIEVPDSVGSSGGIRLVAAGRAELGRVARRLRQGEQRYHLQYRQFAVAPVVFAAHPNVTGVTDLNDRQVVGIYSGKIDNWHDLGGEEGHILVAGREPGDSSRTTLEQQIPGFKDLAHFAGKTIFSTPETVQNIARYRNTIGYMPLSAARSADLKIFTYNHIEPSLENVRQGRYPLVTPLGIVWKDKLTGLAADFLAYLSSRDARRILAASGVVPTP